VRAGARSECAVRVHRRASWHGGRCSRSPLAPARARSRPLALARAREQLGLTAGFDPQTIAQTPPASAAAMPAQRQALAAMAVRAYERSRSIVNQTTRVTAIRKSTQPSARPVAHSACPPCHATWLSLLTSAQIASHAPGGESSARVDAPAGGRSEADVTASSSGALLSCTRKDGGLITILRAQGTHRMQHGMGWDGMSSGWDGISGRREARTIEPRRRRRMEGRDGQRTQRGRGAHKSRASSSCADTRLVVFLEP
jgi:hypothetical protein